MGATLPSLTRYLARRAADLGDVFGRLYSANTLGAVLGAFVAGFFLVEILGLTGSLMAGAAGSAIAGLIALALAFMEGRLPAVAPAPDATSRVASAFSCERRGSDHRPVASVPATFGVSRSWWRSRPG